MFYIEVKPTSKMGNGVFACKNFVAGEIIEICPVIPLPQKFTETIPKPESLEFLEYWFYEWNEDKLGDAMVLGYGMIYNHSHDPNADYKMDFVHNTVTITAKQEIPNGAQIFIDYRYNNDDFLEMIDPYTQEEVKIDAK